jgi:hypothetical protein
MLREHDRVVAAVVSDDLVDERFGARQIERDEMRDHPLQFT